MRNRLTPLKIIDSIIAPIWNNLPFCATIYVLMTLPFWINCISYFMDWREILYCSGIVNWGLNWKLTPFCPIIYSYILCLPLLVFDKLPRIQKGYQHILYFILVCLTTTDIFLAYNFSLGISIQALELLLQTNVQESSEFISEYVLKIGSIVIITSVISIALLTNWVCRLLSKRFQNTCNTLQIITKLGLICILTTTCTYSAPQLHLLGNALIYEPEVSQLINYPTDILSKTLYSLTRFTPHFKETDELRKHIQAYNAECSCIYNSPNIILIIGESFNKHHSNLYGYYLETNPRLTARYNDNELYVFNNVITLSNGTSQCIKYILSTANVQSPEAWYEKPLFPQIFRDAGYKVFWIDNQMINTKYENDFYNLTTTYLNDSIIENALFDVRNTEKHRYDEGLLTEWNKYRKLQSDNNIVVFHLWGQHFKALERYPKTDGYIHFTSDSINRADLDKSKRQNIAHYDNATRYNDAVIDSIISNFENEDAIVIYISDHGEEVYDCSKIYGRTFENPITKGTAKYQYEIPMFIWCSELYRTNHPEIIEQIKNSVNLPFMTDDISHLLFDLAGIQSPYYDETRSIINPNFLVRKRMLNSGYYEDIK